MTREQKRQYWLNHIEAWQDSDLSQIEYARRHNLSVKTFQYHKRQQSLLTPASKPAQAVVPVVVEPPAVSAVPTRIDRRADSSIEGNTTWVYDDGTKGVLSEVSDSVSGFGQVLSYDSYGRPTGAGTTFDGEMYAQSTTYDSFGRVLEKRDAAGASSGVRYLYNEHSYMNAIQDLKSSLEWYRVNSMDARGNTVVQTVGGLKTTRYYDPLTGFLESLVTGIAGSNIQDLGYDWDEVGNLTSRTDKSTGTTLVETFGYDGLNRVTSATVGSQSDQYRYNGLGNITSKTGVGSYTYGQNGAGMHAVTHTSIGNISYQYDANGNMTSGSGRTLVYSTFDKPTRIEKNGHTTQFQYDVNRSRYKRVDTDKNNDTTITRYVAGVEFITRPNGDKEIKRYINGVAIDTTTTKSGGGTENSVQLLFKDHLGSIHTIMDGNTMTVLQRQSFDPFGQRRNPTNWEDLLDSQLSNFNTNFTTRGFTGHEQLDQVGLIHMNGRVYDPKLGRFLQADPFVQAVGNTQNFNRYSYVLNNPLNTVDPSGYIFGKIFKSISKALKSFGRGLIRLASKVFGPEVVNAVGTFFSGWFGGAPGVAAWSYEFNRAMGASSSQAFKAAVISGVSYWAFNPNGGGTPSWSEAAVKVSTNVIAAKDPEIGRVLAFAHSAWGLEPSQIAQQAVGEIAQYKAAKEVQRLANRDGLSLEELNLLLALNSKLGLEVAGSTYIKDDQTVEGFLSRTGGSWLEDRSLIGVIWDVNDTLLNAQGLLDAVSLQAISEGNSGALKGHSLGAARVNNLLRQGWISNGTTLSLPGFAYPAANSSSFCGNLDLICGGAGLSLLRPDTTTVNSPSWFDWINKNHRIATVDGYQNVWAQGGR